MQRAHARHLQPLPRVCDRVPWPLHVLLHVLRGLQRGQRQQRLVDHLGALLVPHLAGERDPVPALRAECAARDASDAGAGHRAVPRHQLAPHGALVRPARLRAPHAHRDRRQRDGGDELAWVCASVRSSRLCTSAGASRPRRLWRHGRRPAAAAVRATGAVQRRDGRVPHARRRGAAAGRVVARRGVRSRRRHAERARGSGRERVARRAPRRAASPPTRSSGNSH
mmetsp:Transcript_8110/g.28849  ORF Transcript_8110/g.28849 Transcript_8110/m.28849 type:complete len:225 (+) Transcript_8110:227-901(+)